MKIKLSAKNVALVVLSVCVAVLAVCLLRDDRTPPAPVVRPEPKEAKPKAQIPEVPGAVERALRKRIKQLEAELKAARAAAMSPTNAPKEVEIHPLPKQGEFRPPNPREMMENLKKNDPKRYEEIQKHAARMRKRHLERTQGRLEYFGSLDTSGMSKEERANHEKLQELLVQRENLPEFSENMTDEEMREAGNQRRELDRSIRAANAAERTALLKQTAGALGLSGDEATVLTEAIQEVIQATESDHGPHGPPPPGGR